MTENGENETGKNSGAEPDAAGEIRAGNKRRSPRPPFRSAEARAKARKTDRARNAREKLRKAETLARKAQAARKAALDAVPKDDRLIVEVAPAFLEDGNELAWTIPSDDQTPETKRFSKTGRPLGAPRKPISMHEVKAAASIQCTDVEIALICNVSGRTFARRKAEDQNFRQAIEEGRAHGKVSLRRKQFKEAVEAGNTQLLIFLGKQYLEQKDQVHSTGAFVDKSGGLLEKLLAIEKNASLDAAKAAQPQQPINENQNRGGEPEPEETLP